MKIQLTLKTPDLDDAIREYNPEFMKEEDVPEDKWDDVYAEWSKIQSTFDKFVKYSEYVYVEIDTETGTARVLEV